MELSTLQLLDCLLKAHEEYIKATSEQLANKDKTIEQLQNTIGQLQTTIEELNAKIANLTETTDELRRMIFGKRSEKTGKADDGETTSETASEAESSPVVSIKSYTRERKKKSKREELYANLPVRYVDIPLTEEEKICEWCNSPMESIGFQVVREELVITPAKVERVRYRQETAVCPECKKSGDGTFVKSTVPQSLIPHSPASESAVAYVIFHKVFMGSPYYRLEKAMLELGVPLPRETMANWIIYCAKNYFVHIFDALHDLLIKRDIIHADETTCQVLHEKNRKADQVSYFWIYQSGNDGLDPIVLYDYCPGRSGDYARDFLEGFHGMLMCDGYQGYNKVKDVTLLCCLVHCRRKFYEAIPADRRKKLKLLDINSEDSLSDPDISEEALKEMIPAETGLAYCNKLFFIEKTLKDLSAEERTAKRKEKEVPIWDNFWSWLETIEALGGSKLEKALNYAKNHKTSLNSYLQDGRCEISNNRAERSAKAYAIGRKNFLFHTSEEGAEASAVMYSLVETAKANKLNVFQYLYTVLLYMPDYLKTEEPAGIEALLPCSKFMKEHCSGLIDVENITSVKHDKLPK